MSSHKGILAAWLGVIGFITYQNFKTPDSSNPLAPVPPPYRYVWSAVVFGILLIASDFINPKITGVIAGGVFVGVAYNTFTGHPITGGSGSAAPAKKSPTKLTGPVSSTGSKPTTNNGQKVAGNNQGGSIFFTGGGTTP